jgi:hypothetical protein
MAIKAIQTHSQRASSSVQTGPVKRGVQPKTFTRTMTNSTMNRIEARVLSRL